MKGRIPKRIFAACFIVTITVSGCSIGSKHSDREKSQQKTAASVQEEFDQHMEEVFQENVSDNGIELHYTLEDPKSYGISEGSKSLGTVSADEKKEIQQELKEIKEFSYEKLTKEQQDTYDVWKDYLTAQKELAQYPYYETVLSPTIGAQAQLPVTFCEFRLKTREDVQDYFTLLSQIDTYFESIMDYEKEKVKRGLFMSDDCADAVISQIHGSERLSRRLQSVDETDSGAVPDGIYADNALIPRTSHVPR